MDLRRIATVLPLGARAITNTRVQATEEARADTKKGSLAPSFFMYIYFITKRLVILNQRTVSQFIVNRSW